MDRDKDCLFCRIIAGEIPSTMVFSDDLVVAFRDVNPQAPTHVLISPRRHLASLDDLTDADEPLMGRVVMTASRLARKMGDSEEGYRLVANCREGAGQSVFHIHFHLLGGRPFHWPPG